MRVRGRPAQSASRSSMRWRSALLLMLVAFLTNPNAAPGVEAERSADDVAFGLMLVIIIFGLLFSPDFGMFMTILKVLIFIACLPALVSLVFSIITGRARASRRPRHDALFRLRRQHGARRDAQALPGRDGARDRGAARLPLRHRARLRLVRARAGCLRVRGAVAADAARPCGAQSVREPRQRAVSPRDAARSSAKASVRAR